MARVRLVSSITEISRAKWNALLHADDAPVLRWEWLHSMESSGSASPQRGWQPLHFTVWEGDTLLGAAPAYLKHHSMGEYVYDFGWADAAARLGVDYYPKLLVGLPLSPLTARRFLVNDDAHRTLLLDAMEAFAKEEGLSSIHVLFPPGDEAAALAARAGYFRRSTMQYHWRNPGYATWDEFLSRFDSKRRNQLKRERGAAGKQGITLRTVRSHELHETHAELAWRFYEATASRHSWGPVQLNREFFHRAFASMPDAIELVVAEREKKVIAGAFNLYNPRRLFGRYWGCFEEHPFLHFNVCLYHSIDDAISRGLQAFEPGAGGEHKISRGFEPTEIHSVHRIFNVKLDAAIRAATARERAQVQALTSHGEAVSGLRPWKPASTP